MPEIRVPYDRAAYLAIKKKFLPCNHEAAELRRRVNTMGRLMLWRQCPECGSGVGSQMKYSALDGSDPLALPQFDERACNAHRECSWLHCKLAYWIVSQSRMRKWWLLYAAYLDTDEWRAKSRACLQRANFKCFFCQNLAVQSHHTTYERVGNEKDEDLVAVCMPCHKSIHPHMTD